MDIRLNGLFTKKCNSIRLMMRPVRNGDVGDWRLPDGEFLASFRLPTQAERSDTLALLHPLPREDRIVFEEVSHTYTIDRSTKVPRSVTGLLHSFGEEFGARGAAEAMQRSPNWEVKR